MLSPLRARRARKKENPASPVRNKGNAVGMGVAAAIEPLSIVIWPELSGTPPLPNNPAIQLTLDLERRNSGWDTYRNRPGTDAM